MPPPSSGGPDGLRGFVEWYAPTKIVPALRALPADTFDARRLRYFEYNWGINSSATLCDGNGLTAAQHGQGKL